MAILTPSDKNTYFPDTELQGSELLSALARAEAIAQGPAGANRSLEKKQWVELLPFVDRGITYLSYSPIDLTASVTVQLRGGDIDTGFGRVLPDNEWTTIDAEDYEIDAAFGELRVKSLPGYHAFTTVGVYSVFRIAGSRSPLQRPTRPNLKRELRITYSAGFDFAATPESYEVKTIKRAVAGIMSVQSTPAASGIASYKADRFYSVSYNAAASTVAQSSRASSLLDEYLLILQKYRPREGF